MKKSNIIMTGSVAVIVFMAATGMAMTTLAAENVVSGATTSTSSVQKLKHEKFKTKIDAKKQVLRAKMEAKKQAKETTRLAMQAALDLGDYNAWVKVVPAGSPILTKITAVNFPKLVEANKLLKQSNQIMKDLGINRGDMMSGRLGVDNDGPNK